MRFRHDLAVLGACVVAASAYPSRADAGGFEVPDLGTIPIGRGAAFTARADSLAAYHYNPAGLSKLPGPNLLISANVINLNSEFTRGGSGQMVLPPNNETIEVFDPADDPNTGGPFATVRNGRRFGPSPLFVFSWGDVGVPGLALAVGVGAPTGFGTHDWPDQGGQRYTIRAGRFSFFHVGGGISYRFNRYLMVGANFLSGFFTADFNTATRRGLVGGAQNEAHDEDNDVTVKARDRFVPSGNFGVLSNPLHWLELGLAVRLPFRTKAVGTLEYEGSVDASDSVLATQSRVELHQTFPTVVRTGVRYIHRVFDVELDFVWENWNSVDRIDVEFSNPNADFAPADTIPTSAYDDPSLLYLDPTGDGTSFQPIIATDPPLDFRDTVSVRLGSDVEVLPGRLTVRAGGFWQSSAYPTDHRTLTVRFPFVQQFGVGGGLTWHVVQQLDLSLGYLHIFQPEVRVRNGIAQANAFREPDDPTILGNIVNNGRYRAGLNIFGLAVEGHFWRGRNSEQR